MSQELKKEISKLSQSNFSGVKFPKGIDVVRTRLKKQGVSDKIIKSIKHDAIAVINANMEVSLAKMQLNLVLSQLPLLLTPITATMAINNIRAQLPFIVTSFDQLGMEIPESLLPVLKSISTAQKIINSAKKVLIGPLEPLKNILGIK